jgi:hypothetical protein
MIVPIVLLAIWIVVTVPMALVLLVDVSPRRPAPPRAPVIALGERREDGPSGHLPHAA